MKEIRFRVWFVESEKMYSWEDLIDKIGLSESVFVETKLWKPMQYTGLKDKNGKEIYEGDLFRTTNKHGYSSNCIAEVLFMDGAFVIQLYRSDDMEIAPELILDFKRSFQDSFEIIGDIHTTPKLLEKL